MLKVNMPGEVQKVVRRYRGVESLPIIERGLVLWGADLLVKTAKSEIDRLVYDAPLPASADHDPHYLDHARTRRTRGAIKRQRNPPRQNVASAIAHVDKNDYLGYYYALVLNFGGRPGGRLARYRARPFWTNGVAVVKAVWRQAGLRVRADISHHVRADK